MKHDDKKRKHVHHEFSTKKSRKSSNIKSYFSKKPASVVKKCNDSELSLYEQEMAFLRKNPGLYRSLEASNDGSINMGALDRISGAQFDDLGNEVSLLTPEGIKDDYLNGVSNINNHHPVNHSCTDDIYEDFQINPKHILSNDSSQFEDDDKETNTKIDTAAAQCSNSSDFQLLNDNTTYCSNLEGDILADKSMQEYDSNVTSVISSDVHLTNSDSRSCSSGSANSVYIGNSSVVTDSMTVYDSSQLASSGNSLAILDSGIISNSSHSTNSDISNSPEIPYSVSISNNSQSTNSGINSNSSTDSGSNSSPSTNSSIISNSSTDSSSNSNSSQSKIRAEWSFMGRKVAAPLCSGHKEEAVLRTSKKKGPNFNRRFYSCSRGAGRPGQSEAQCGYFKWI